MNKIYIIIGSTRSGRIGPSIAEWFYKQAVKRKDLSFEIVDLIDWELPMLNEPIPAKADKYLHDHTKKWSEKIAQADGFIIVTPEYNAGYPASLKNALDYLHKEWINKPVAFVSYGWRGGVRAVEQLREVVGNFKMIQTSSTVAILFTSTLYTNGQLNDPAKNLVEYTQAAETVLDEIAKVVINK